MKITPGITPRLMALLLPLLITACANRGAESNQSHAGQLYTGYVEADLVYVAAPSAGWLTTSAVLEGDAVVAEDLLFELEAELEGAQLEEATDRLQQSEAQARDLATGARAEEIEALDGQLAEAKTSLDLAALERQRLSALAKQGIVPQDQVDRANAEHDAAAARVATLKANIEVARLAGRRAVREAALATASAAEAAVRQARWHLEQRRVEARIGGRVEEIFHRPGEFVAAGSPVLAILPEDSLEVRFFVPQAELTRIALGNTVEVLVDGSPEPVQARVSFVARKAEFTPPVIYSADSREKLVFLVRARIDGPAALRPGQPVDVRLQ